MIWRVKRVELETSAHGFFWIILLACSLINVVICWQLPFRRCWRSSAWAFLIPRRFLGVLLRQRQLLLRANQLITADLERGIALAPELMPSCNLAGRQLFMQILSSDGELTTYTVGAGLAPSAIWQGQVLMSLTSIRPTDWDGHWW